MAAQTIWKGVIEFGDVRVPVRFFSAIQDRAVHFNLLHAKDNVRVKQVMVNARGEPVAMEDVRRGFEVAKDEYVVVEKEELGELTPKESRTIEVEAFVPNQQVNHQWYERPYYLGPDDSTADYAALVAALSDHKLEGIARWVMRKRAYVGSLQVSHGHLVMVTLRYADEVVASESLPQPEGRGLDKKELALAEQLVEALHTDFDPSQYRDEHRQRVLDFIEAKAEGRRPKLKLVRPPRASAPDKLAAILSASVKSARKERLSA